MKKLLLVILFSYLFPHMLSADQLEQKIRDFSKWLNLNGYDQYLDKTGDPLDMVLDRSLCTSEAYWDECVGCLLYTSPSPRDRIRSRMPSSA